jgi:sterol desaturase/sphingolipid hydroxylase (fatty acid hydroxylase superfamily)
VPNIILYAIPGFILLMMIEIYLSQRMHRDNYEAKDTLSSLAMGIGSQVFGLITKGIYILIFFWLYEHRLFTIGWAWWAWILVFFADDFSYYIFHFTSHKCRYFWASHVVHHSSRKYTLATALRQTWTGDLTGSKVFWFWMPLLGFHPLMIFTMMAISLIYQFWIHTELIDRMPGWFEFFFNTPSHHRVHHSNEIRYLDKNHGGILIIWDRIFGTFKAEKEHPVYGIRKDFRSYNPIRIAFDEWAEIVRDLLLPISIRNKLNYVFGPPGWSHDGSRKTTSELQKSLLEES